MAVIYSYPLKTPKRDDLLIGTVTYDENVQDPVVGNPTVSFTVGSLINLVEAQGAAQNLQQVTNIGNTTTNSIVISNSLKVAGEYYDSSNQPGTSGQILSSTATGTQWINVAAQGVTSVGLSMPAAFTVTNSPITQSGTLTVTGAGTAAQYINGLGNLASFPASYVLPVATTVALGGIKIGYTQNAKNYPIELNNEQAYVNVPWTDTQTIQTITGTGSDNTDSGVLLSDSGGTVLILGSGSVAASQTGDTITLTGTDTGVTGVTLATADSTGSPLSESITNRELTITSHKYIGGSNVGYVPEGGTSDLYLKGDGTWEAIPTGLQFKGTWDASGGGGGTPDLTLAANKGPGFLWICDVAGTAYPNGGTNPPSTWNLGDWAVYDGTTWTRVPATNSGVTSLTTTDGGFIDLTPNTATTGAVTVTADLSAQDGTSDTSTRFLSKDNTWDVPSYTTNTDTTYTAGTGLTLTGTVFSADIDATQATSATNSLSTTTNRYYAVQLDNNSTVADAKLVVNVPWAESYNWTIKDSTTGSSVVDSGETIQFVTATGPLGTALTEPTTGNFVMTLTSPDTNTTYSVFTGADGTNAGTSGLVPAPAAADNVKFLRGDATWASVPQGDITEIKVTAPITGAATSGIATIGIDTMGAATASVAGTKGAVPASAAGDETKFLRADATWVIPTNTWIANAVTVAGYVAAPAATDANLVWKTNASGEPAWRADATGSDTTYTIGSGNTKIITLTGSDGNNSTVTFADGNNISLSGNNGIITIASTAVSDTGIPAVISDGAATPNLSFASNVTAAMVRTQIGAGTGDGVVESLTTTGSSGAATLTNAGVLNIPTPPTYTLDADQSSQGNDSNPNITLDASVGTDDSVQLFGGNLITVTRDGASKIDIASTAAPNTVFVGPSGAGSAQGGTAGLVPAPSHTTYNGEYFLKQDATWAIPPGQGIISESVAVANATVNNTPLTATINSATRTLALSSKKYMGGNLVGYVPNGGTSSTYLRGDGTWGSVGSQFQGTWSADTNFGFTPFGTPSLEIPSIGPNPFSNGDFYICDVVGTATPNGSGTTPNSWAIGDTVIWDDGNSEWVKVPATTSGVNSIDTTDGTYINLTPNSASTGSITVTADLSAQDGTSNTTTRFLSKDNTWDVPSYTTNENTTYDFLTVATGGTNVNPALRLDPSSGSNDDVTLTAGNCISITRVSDTEIEFVNTCPDSGIPAVLTDGANPGVTSLYTNTTADAVRTTIGAGTGDGVVESLTTTGTSGASTLSAGVLNIPQYENTQENTEWYVRDSTGTNKTIDNLTYLKFVTATGALGTALTGAGTTGDPYVMTLTSPDTNTTYTLPLAADGTRGGVQIGYTENGKNYPVELSNEKMFVNVPWTDNNTTYTAGNGINFSGNPATQINADINYISTSGSNNYLKLGADDRGTTVPTQGEIVYLGTGNDEITSRAYVSDLPFTNNTGTVTSIATGNGLSGGTITSSGTLTMSGIYTGDFTVTGDAVTDKYRFRTALTTNPSTTVASIYDQSTVGLTLSAHNVSIRNYTGSAMVESARFTNSSLTVIGDLVAFGSPSDIRLKENIKPIKSALDKVSKLQGVTFDWKKSDSILNIKEDVGFIAQDVQKVMPELVRENKDGMLSMRHQGITPILLEAIKELKAEIEELKSNNCNCNK
jgi:hypothetical protein